MSIKEIHLVSGSQRWNSTLDECEPATRPDSCGSVGFRSIGGLADQVAKNQKVLARSVYSMRCIEQEGPYHLITARYPAEIAHIVEPAKVKQEIETFNRKFRDACPDWWSHYIIEFSSELGYYVHWLGCAPIDILEEKASSWRLWTDDHLTNIERLECAREFYECRAELFDDKHYMGRAKVTDTYLNKGTFGFVQMRNCPLVRPHNYELIRDDFHLQNGRLIGDLLPEKTTYMGVLEWQSSISGDGARSAPHWSDTGTMEQVHLAKLWKHIELTL